MNMAYIRSKKVKGNTYYYAVEGKLNKKGLVKQKVILYLGNVKRIIEVFNFYKKHHKD
jgi:hypothetical protein